MKKILTVLICVLMLASFVTGCAKKEASAQAAINASEAKKTVEEKVNYLVEQAKEFYSSKQFQDAVATASYVLSNLDQNSQAAKDLIEKAKAAITAEAQKALDAAKKKMGL